MNYNAQDFEQSARQRIASPRSPNKFRSKSLRKTIDEQVKQSINDMRLEFQMNLAKVYDNHTRKEGVLACHRLIQSHCASADSEYEQQQALRMILAALSERSSQIANAKRKPQAIMLHVQMFGFLVKCCKTNLEDPLDKPMSLIKTLKRILDSLYLFLKENSDLVWKGCGLSMVEIIENCFPQKEQPVHGNTMLGPFIIEPLLNFLQPGSDVVQLNGASYCIRYLTNHFIQQQYFDMLEQTYEQIVNTVTKHKIDNEQVLQCLDLILQNMGLRSLQLSYGHSIVESIIGMCFKVIVSQTTIPQYKIISYDLLTTLAKTLQHYAFEDPLTIPTYSKLVMKAVESVKIDKHPNLMQARNNTKESWLILQNKSNKIRSVPNATTSHSMRIRRDQRKEMKSELLLRRQDQSDSFQRDYSQQNQDYEHDENDQEQIAYQESYNREISGLGNYEQSSGQQLRNVRTREWQNPASYPQIRQPNSNQMNHQSQLGNYDDRGNSQPYQNASQFNQRDQHQSNIGYQQDQNFQQQNPGYPVDQYRSPVGQNQQYNQLPNQVSNGGHIQSQLQGQNINIQDQQNPSQQQYQTPMINPSNAYSYQNQQDYGQANMRQELNSDMNPTQVNQSRSQIQGLYGRAAKPEAISDPFSFRAQGQDSQIARQIPNNDEFSGNFKNQEITPYQNQQNSLHHYNNQQRVISNGQQLDQTPHTNSANTAFQNLQNSNPHQRANQQNLKQGYQNQSQAFDVQDPTQFNNQAQQQINGVNQQNAGYPNYQYPSQNVNQPSHAINPSLQGQAHVQSPNVNTANSPQYSPNLMQQMPNQQNGQAQGSSQSPNQYLETRNPQPILIDRQANYSSDGKASRDDSPSLNLQPINRSLHPMLSRVRQESPINPLLANIEASAVHQIDSIDVSNEMEAMEQMIVDNGGHGVISPLSFPQGNIQRGLRDNSQHYQQEQIRQNQQRIGDNQQVVSRSQGISNQGLPQNNAQIEAAMRALGIQRQDQAYPVTNQLTKGALSSQDINKNEFNGQPQQNKLDSNLNQIGNSQSNQQSSALSPEKPQIFRNEPIHQFQQIQQNPQQQKAFTSSNTIRMPQHKAKQGQQSQEDSKQQIQRLAQLEQEINLQSSHDQPQRISHSVQQQIDKIIKNGAKIQQDQFYQEDQEGERLFNQSPTISVGNLQENERIKGQLKQNQAFNEIGQQVKSSIQQLQENEEHKEQIQIIDQKLDEIANEIRNQSEKQENQLLNRVPQQSQEKINQDREIMKNLIDTQEQLSARRQALNLDQLALDQPLEAQAPNPVTHEANENNGFPQQIQSDGYINNQEHFDNRNSQQTDQNYNQIQQPFLGQNQQDQPIQGRIRPQSSNLQRQQTQNQFQNAKDYSQRQRNLAQVLSQSNHGQYQQSQQNQAYQSKQYDSTLNSRHHQQQKVHQTPFNQRNMLAPLNHSQSQQVNFQSFGGDPKRAGIQVFGSQEDSAQMVLYNQLSQMQFQMNESFKLISNKVNQIESRLEETQDKVDQSERLNASYILARASAQALSRQPQQSESDLKRNQNSQDQFHSKDFKSMKKNQSQSVINQRGHPHQELQNQDQTVKQTRLTQTWSQVLNSLKNQKYEEAYQKTLKESDDIYLLRLIASTGPISSKLETETAKNVLSKVNKIVRSGAIQAIQIEWLEALNQKGIGQRMSDQDANEHLDTLYLFSKSKMLNDRVQERAANIYENIRINMQKRK